MRTTQNHQPILDYMGLSVLIATKNHPVDVLLSALDRQAEALSIHLEVLVGDDASNQTVLKESTLETTNSLSVKLIKNPENLGALITKYQLAEIAEHSRLLLLDADVQLQDNYLKNYLSFSDQNIDAVSGGVMIPKNLSKESKELRYYYGIKRESRPASERSKNKYSNIVSANLLIDKALFIKAAAPILSNNYGLDIFLGGQLKRLQTEIIHIDNPVIHLGIEENDIYLAKIERGLKHMAWQVIREKKHPHSRIFYNYQSLKKLKCFRLFLWLFRLSKPMLLKQITSSKPNLLLFDIYRLGLFCSYAARLTKN
ncbi:MAG: glycosyltransferase [Flavobacteriaceae bacterium]|nr:glycosyltransferase [Flavobacteriaceae bacterium]